MEVTGAEPTTSELINRMRVLKKQSKDQGPSEKEFEYIISDFWPKKYPQKHARECYLECLRRKRDENKTPPRSLDAYKEAFRDAIKVAFPYSPRSIWLSKSIAVKSVLVAMDGPRGFPEAIDHWSGSEKLCVLDDIAYSIEKLLWSAYEGAHIKLGAAEIKQHMIELKKLGLFGHYELREQLEDECRRTLKVLCDADEEFNGMRSLLNSLRIAGAEELRLMEIKSLYMSPLGNYGYDEIKSEFIGKYAPLFARFDRGQESLPSLQEAHDSAKRRRNENQSVIDIALKSAGVNPLIGLLNKPDIKFTFTKEEIRSRSSACWMNLEFADHAWFMSCLAAINKTLSDRKALEIDWTLRLRGSMEKILDSYISKNVEGMDFATYAADQTLFKKNERSPGVDIAAGINRAMADERFVLREYMQITEADCPILLTWLQHDKTLCGFDEHFQKTNLIRAEVDRKLKHMKLAHR